MKVSLVLVALMVIPFGCGGGGSSDVGGEGPAAEASATDKGEGGDSAKPKDGEVCLSSCSTSADTMFSFNAPQIKLTPDHCEVANVLLFDLGGGISVFYQADCGDGMQVYQKKFSYDLTLAVEPTVVSSNCHSLLQSVMFMTATNSDLDSVLVTYNCKVSSGKGRTFARTIRGIGSPLSPVFVEELNISTYGDPLGADQYKVQWNSSANAFGLARRGILQRLSPDANILGGKVAIGNSYGKVSGLTVQDGSWVLFQESSSCSKVNALGIPLCNNKSVGLDPGFLMTSSRYIDLTTRPSTVSYQPFNLETCSVGERKMVGVLNDAYITESFGSTRIGEFYEALLYAGSQAQLSLVFVSRREPISLSSEVAVVNTGAITKALVTAIKSKILVSYVEAGGAWLKVSDQSIK